MRSGLTRRLEIRAALNSYALQSESANRNAGIEDSRVGLKYVLSSHSKGFRPVVSVIVQSSVPTGSESFTASKPIPEAKIAATWSGKSRLSLISNAGINFGQPNHEDGIVFFTAAPWISLSHSLSGFAELYSGQSRQVDGGFSWLLNHGTQLDVRVGSSISADSPAWFFGAGFVARW